MYKKIYKKIFTLLFLAILSLFLFSATTYAAPRKVQVITVKHTNGKVDTLIHLRKGKAERFGEGDKLKYKSADSSIVKVKKNGEIKGLKVGKTKVRLYTKSGKLKKTISVRVFDTSPAAIYQRLLLKKKQFPAGMYYTDNYPYSLSVWKKLNSYKGIVIDENGAPYAYRSNIEVKTRYESYSDEYWTFARYGVGCAAFASELSDWAYGSIRGSVYYDVNRIAAGDIISIQGKIYTGNGGSDNFFDGHNMIVLRVSGNNVYIADANFCNRVRWNVAYTKNQLKRVFLVGLTRN